MVNKRQQTNVQFKVDTKNSDVLKDVDGHRNMGDKWTLAYTHTQLLKQLFASATESIQRTCS